MINVTIFNEFCHEKTDEKVKAIYPEGIHRAIASFLASEADLCIRTVTLDDAESFEYIARGDY